MKLIDIFRTAAASLSSWFPNHQISESRDLKIRGFILDKIKNIKLNNKNLKKTHIEFNRQILNLLKNSWLSAVDSLEKSGLASVGLALQRVCGGMKTATSFLSGGFKSVKR